MFTKNEQRISNYRIGQMKDHACTYNISSSKYTSWHILPISRIFLLSFKQAGHSESLSAKLEKQCEW